MKPTLRGSMALPMPAATRATRVWMSSASWIMPVSRLAPRKRAICWLRPGQRWPTICNSGCVVSARSTSNAAGSGPVIWLGTASTSRSVSNLCSLSCGASGLRIKPICSRPASSRSCWTAEVMSCRCTITSGACCLKRATREGASAKLDSPNPILRRPAAPLASARAWCSNPLPCSTRARAWGSNWVPMAVSSAPWRPRLNRVLPSASSSPWICLVSAGCVMKSRLAASR